MFQVGLPVIGETGIDVAVTKSSSHVYGEEESESYQFQETVTCEAPPFTEKECKLLIKQGKITMPYKMTMVN